MAFGLSRRRAWYRRGIGVVSAWYRRGIGWSWLVVAGRGWYLLGGFAPEIFSDLWDFLIDVYYASIRLFATGEGDWPAIFGMSLETSLTPAGRLFGSGFRLFFGRFMSRGMKGVGMLSFSVDRGECFVVGDAADSGAVVVVVNRVVGDRVYLAIEAPGDVLVDRGSVALSRLRSRGVPAGSERIAGLLSECTPSSGG